jgi:predicted kinase
MFREYCSELTILDTPWPFANDHARYRYFATPGRDPRWAAYDDTTFTVTVLSGLPASGKDHWTSASDLPVVSLDALRSALKVRPTDEQGPVLAAARAEARSLLRKKQPFVWNATNVTRQQRSAIVSLAAGYGARVEIVSVEAPAAVISTRNAARPAPVPAAAVERMIARWETPDITEAHAVTWLDTRPSPTRRPTEDRAPLEHGR